MTDVSRLITEAFGQADQRYPDLADRWTRVSFRIGPLPNSLLSGSIQRHGSLDILLRSMEDETATRLQAEGQSSIVHFQKMLSVLWVGDVYETLRLLKDRDLAIGNEFQTLAHDFRLLRIPLEKHEIASEGQLKQPLQMRGHPPKNNDTDIYEYDKSDPQRAHIMPWGISQRGSVTWQVLDLRANEERLVERRELSDRFLSLWDTARSEAKTGTEFSK
jgi:hypothetical protein